MDVNWVFNEVPEVYDRVRPTCSDQLFVAWATGLYAAFLGVLRLGSEPADPLGIP